MNFFEFLKQFPTEQACIDHFIKVRYGKEMACNHCGCKDKVYKMEGTPRKFICHNCKNTFSVFKGTIFEHSSTDLRKWMYAIHLFLNGKKGISGYQLKREIAVTYKCAWRMLKQIRTAMGNKQNPDFVNAIIEIDETYVGGKPRKGAKKGIYHHVSAEHLQHYVNEFSFRYNNRNNGNMFDLVLKQAIC